MWLFVGVLSAGIAIGNTAAATDAVTKIRGKSVKLYQDPKGRNKIDTVKTADIVLPAEILGGRKGGPYVHVRLKFNIPSRKPVDAWIKRFKVKTNIPAKLVVHCSSKDDPNSVRVAGVRAAGNKQCK